MEYRKIDILDLPISVVSLGTWAFGSDEWWGPQSKKDSFSVLKKAIEGNITLIDTAPVYGRGYSETLIGEFIKKHSLRNKVILATKLGLGWEGRRIFHSLKPERMRQEIQESMDRLQTDYFDLYQVHWHDPDTPIKDTALVMDEFYKNGRIRSIGVSNYTVEQISEFMEHSPLHFLQPPYNMFKRDIEKDIIPFCIKHKICIINYIPLHSGILTGKFFFQDVPVPNDVCRKKHRDLHEPLFSINKEILTKVKTIADKYNKTLTQLVLKWTYMQQGITSVISGARNIFQIEDILGSTDWELEQKDIDNINEILKERDEKIS